ncbi:thymidine phosphorylase [Litoreibacter arenae]|uniref:thymidine phosphorylase n=1 Tax=Litoreibacter arenae DSM 19593 TaxID=1123360 RepID=S9S4G5_9RHOB|nr:thymidine phosphorylase [Litoreibacter arenae]EPX81049.1 Thymidine phosphorylase [Litoreibacter arenae DSM 19593]
MDAAQIIGKIRTRETVTAAECRWFGKALAEEHGISDAQAGAFAMAVAIEGLGADGRVGLTEGMRDSGDVLRWKLPGPVLDKHSTGGVGDPVSLVLAPALAVCGAYVPMVSGRGLGHTGGTLDKLEAIPGYVCNVTTSKLQHVVREAGCAIVGASGEVAPADKRLYAIRDVTATVDSIDLITASILAKKLAAGLEGLVLDVKTGNGAILRDAAQAKRLAYSLVEVAKGAGCPTTALITDMSQPLATAAGNAVEIRAVMEALSGSGQKRLREVALALGAELLGNNKQMNLDTEAAWGALNDAITSGAAMERFCRMVAYLGGPTDFDETWRFCLPEANIVREVLPLATGYVRAIDTRALGLAVVELGGGRRRETDKIDPSVGLSGFKRIGEKVDKTTPLAMVHAATEEAAAKAERAVRKAFQIGSAKVNAPELFVDRVAV